MITELILNGLFGVADIFLRIIPEIEWTVDTSAWEYGRDILSMIAYLLPMGHIRAVIAFIISVIVFRITIAVMLEIKGFIPFLN